MKAVADRHDFPGEEEKIVELWERIDAFQTSLKKNEGKPLYTFYDGPPFATGLPHYGHLLAGTIKDIVTRFAHQTGHSVERRFGWDCHGLPIEFEIDKKHGIKTKEDVEKWGIANYNEACRSIVMTYSSEWRKIVTRIGRWIDFDNDYKTMDAKFMESVWWVFSEIYKKGLVYQGYKVMPYSTTCTTPLSNFEANLNYKDTNDPAIVVSFPLESDPSVSFLAWTTTPWTLPSNLALCLNPVKDYVTVFDKKTGRKFILMEARLRILYKAPEDPKSTETDEYRILSRAPGKSFEGLKYVPILPYFTEEYKDRAFRTVVDDYVTEESGTGIVHQAPGFGEQDYTICLREGICDKVNIPCPIDANGRFLSNISHFAGKYVKDADKDIIKHLKDHGRLIDRAEIVHSYPFCWRSDTPLIYRTIPSWFVKVEDFKDKLLENNKKTYWVPSFVKEKKFHNWLEDARDWAISRNRYWGTPLPIWISDDGQEKIVVGSVAELEQLSGRKVTDLHRHFIDDITIQSKEGRGVLKRVPEVFDCWFESGSMPYAQVHYPFENKEKFENGFPADFIAEGIDQTRGWFYTLLVISTALFGEPPFKNLIVNGLVLASDGKKMSKRLKNYPMPMEIVDKFGADALRLYLIDSPVVRAESLKFNEKGVGEIIKDVFLRWFNAYRLFVQNVHRVESDGRTYKPDPTSIETTQNVMDKWVISSLQTLIEFVVQEMAAYRLYTVVPVLVKFIESLANWYVRLNRPRLKGSKGHVEEQQALDTLHFVLTSLCRVMAPFTPFFTEHLYQNLRLLDPPEAREDSVHYLSFPPARDELRVPAIERSVGRMQEVIELGRVARDRRKLPFKTPLLELLVYQKSEEFLEDIVSLEQYILKELNIKKLTIKKESGEGAVALKAKPDRKRLGKRLRGDMDLVDAALDELSTAELENFEKTGSITILGHLFDKEDIQVVREFAGDTKRYEAAWSESVLIVLDTQLTPELEKEGLLREVVNRIQRLRKSASLSQLDSNVSLSYKVVGKGKPATTLSQLIATEKEYLQEKTKTKIVNAPLKSQVLASGESKVNNVGFELTLYRT
eukprot:TRINITY_DN3362_c0_g1_i1.p1 TRINITY_DN3362_c0_g1~~TRINITY_DN3362_c0_g1_i1.p1  ORF type:complete len:1073 (-),score=204.87 TRINITY_DN3362_c0_g1_i1:40-3258(-)